jgi:flagellar biosynthesis protein FliQ
MCNLVLRSQFCILGALTELWKMTISFIMSACCLSVRVFISGEQLGSHWMDFCEIRYLSIFKKIYEEFQVLLKSDKNNGYCAWRAMYVFDHIAPNS